MSKKNDAISTAKRIGLVGLFCLLISSPAVAQGAPNFQRVSKASQNAILAINVANGVAKHCRIPFNRGKMLVSYTDAMRKRGEAQDDIDLVKRAFAEFSAIYDKTPDNASGRPACTEDEKPGYREMFRKMASGIFPS